MTFQELDALRATYRKNYIITTITSTILILLPFAVFFIAPYLTIPIAIVGIFFTIILTIKSEKNRKPYIAAYKSYFIESTMEKTFTKLHYSHTEGIPRNTISLYGFIDTADRYRSNDYTSGKYKGINFEQADVHIEREYTDSDGDTYYSTIFQGRYMIFDFNRNFEDRLQLVSKGFSAARIKHTKKLFQKTEKHQTESASFNKKFRIYGSDGQEVFYILDPAFIERIEKFYDDLGCPLMLGFENKKVHIAIHNRKDSFEPPHGGKPFDEQKEFEKVSRDIKIITDFVDDLRLNNYTYHK